MASDKNPFLIQLVPRLKPGRCGVSDAAVVLAGELKTAYGIDSAFAVLNSNEGGRISQPVAYCKPSELPERCRELAGGRSGAAVLLHLSGYGFAPDGAPAFLVDAITHLRAGGAFRMAVYFHELFATGRPWESAFWRARRQKEVMLAIAQQCDLRITSISTHVDWLKSRLGAGQTVHRLPVFSTIGETSASLPVEPRERAMAVFGLPESRQRTYREIAKFASMFGRLEIERIFDFGPDGKIPSAAAGLPVERMGPQEAGKLAALISGLRFGFVSAPPHCLAKSSIFANFCALGTIPVVGTPFPGEVDGLRDGVHVISPASVHRALQSGWGNCARAARDWYAGHSRRVHAEFYAEWLKGGDPRADLTEESLRAVTAG